MKLPSFLDRKHVIHYARKGVGFILMAILLGFLMDYTAKQNNPDHPAGFWWGMAHGALMPACLPALVMGHDTTIYAPYNKGRIYKIGYTFGVNACGALFFGMAFLGPRKP